jgi:hypothetical protein
LTIQGLDVRGSTEQTMVGRSVRWPRESPLIALEGQDDREFAAELKDQARESLVRTGREGSDT